MPFPALAAGLAALGGGSTAMGAMNVLNTGMGGLYAIDMLRQLFGGGGGEQGQVMEQEQPETQQQRMMRELLRLQQERSAMRMGGGHPWQ